MTEQSMNISFSENRCLRIGLSCHNTTPRRIFEAKPHHHKPSLDWRAYSEDSQLEVMKSKGSQGSQSWGLNREKPTKREKGRKTADIQPFTPKRKLLSASFLSTEAQWQLYETSMNKNHITHPWGPSSAQEFQRQCTASDMRHVGREGKSRMLESWTSKVRNTESSKARKKTGDQSWGMARGLECFMDGVKFQHPFILKAFFFPLIRECNSMPKLIS